MNKFLIGSAVALALTSTSLSAAPIRAKGSFAQVGTGNAEQIWLTQGKSGKGKGNGAGGQKRLKKGNGNAGNGNGNAGRGNRGNGNAGNWKAQAGNGNAKPGNGNEQASNGNPGNGKPAHAGGPKNNANGNGNGANGRRAFTPAEREEAVSRFASTPAPEGRDMTRILGATALALATPQLVVADTPENELNTHSNCSPGLAKKDPPCVPPGLAKNGMSYDEWASYDQDDYDEFWLERREDWLGYERDFDPNPDLMLLRSDQIARLYDLDPAPEGYRYDLIDGLPVMLDQEDYNSLLLVNQMAQVADLADGVPIAPMAALTQNELITMYRLPQLGADENYAMVNGQLVRMNDSAYGLLQMLRIARAVL
ncbi:hypothetical protein Salmuc_03931 [Salipiger mucosus DSM 16094]|uniref:Uncharacterized protein n=2 Tax=Salipiger mucosus TaxID=263378 RepID=S9RJM2_9RHOB|nr:hypothetical protein Salmuc_03931 [Salipiger mucosus DSM 16094]